MRRPVTVLSVLFVIAVWVSVTLNPPVYDMNPKADGRYITITGTVGSREYAAGSQNENPYLKIALSSVVLEDGVPEEASFDMYGDDKILCEIEDETGKQETWCAEGTRVRVRGKIRLYKRPSNDGEFNEYLYYNCINGFLFTLEDTHILSYTEEKDKVRSLLFPVRKYLSGAIDRLYTGKHGERGAKCASALKAMLLGQSSLIDRGLKEEFQAAGIIHVICISGLHISMIGMGIFNFLRRAGAPVPACSVFSLVIILLYGEVTGMHTSCVRALVMFGFQMAAKTLGRTFDMITALSVAAVLLLIEQPCYLFHSGFLFSFAAVAAAGIISPVVSRREQPFVIPLYTLPVHLNFYYSFPLYSVLLNLLVIALAPFILAGGLAAVFLYALQDKILPFLPLQSIAGYLAGAAAEIPYVILSVFEGACSFTEKLPLYSIIAGKPHIAVIALYYVLLTAAAAVSHKRYSAGLKAVVFQIAALCAALFILLQVRYTPPLSLYMLDVGQGDSLCIRTRDNSGTCNILVDGGSSSRKKIGRYIVIPFLKYHGIPYIDYCIVTHDDMDHCSAVMELIDQCDSPGGIRVGNIALPSVADDCKGENYLKIEAAAAQKMIPVTYLHRGMELKRENMDLKCVHPIRNCRYDDANAYSAVLLLTCGRFSALLTGDLEGEGETDFIRYLGDRRLNINVLKAAHHGSGNATTEDFLRKVSSHTALISCGQNNSYGHPAPETVRRLLKAGMRIFDTRIDGQISITTDGSGEYSVHTFIDKSD